jgi:hypothetical protein
MAQMYLFCITVFSFLIFLNLLTFVPACFYTGFHSYRAHACLNFFKFTFGDKMVIQVRNVPIAVVGNLQQKGAIVLAASPPMKKRFRVKTG